MFEYDIPQVVEVFRKAKNANSALKNFLKKEVKNDDPTARFVKDLKEVISAPRPGALEGFLQKSLPRYEVHTLVLARYAHPEALEKVSEAIFTKYAEDFNKTYEKKEKSIEVKDRKKFESIVREVCASLDTLLMEQSLPNTSFMKNVVLFWLFDQEVLREVAPLIRSIN